MPRPPLLHTRSDSGIGGSSSSSHALAISPAHRTAPPSGAGTPVHMSPSSSYTGQGSSSSTTYPDAGHTPRPSVDPEIKGVPQGWDDDPDVAVPIGRGAGLRMTRSASATLAESISAAGTQSHHRLTTARTGSEGGRRRNKSRSPARSAGSDSHSHVHVAHTTHGVHAHTSHLSFRRHDRRAQHERHSASVGDDEAHDQPRLARRITSLRGEGLSSWRSSVKRHVAHAVQAVQHPHLSHSFGYHSTVPMTHSQSHGGHSRTSTASHTHTHYPHYSLTSLHALHTPSSQSPQSPQLPPLPHLTHHHSATSPPPSTATMSVSGSSDSDFATLFTTTSSARPTRERQASAASAASILHFALSDASNISITTSLVPKLPETPTDASSSPNLNASTADLTTSSNPAPCQRGAGGSGKPQSPRGFLPPNIDQVLPFASGPFSAWDAASPAASLRSGASPAGWTEVRGRGGTKRVYRDVSAHGRVYKVGYEQAMLDLEARLHETMWELAGENNPFLPIQDGDHLAAPRTVLDLGTGTGLWAISQARQWPDTHFVAADIVPVHTDVTALAHAEERARTSSCGVAPGTGQWASVAERVEFHQYNFLDGLPYDSGCFDMVHMRFLGLGVPETRWAELLDEAVRVLRPGGVLEIVEMSYDPPPTTPPSVASAFASLLLAEYIPPNPLLALQLHLPATAGLVAATTRPVFSESYIPDQAPGALADAASAWIASALEYKGRAKPSTVTGHRAAAALIDYRPDRWSVAADQGVSSPTTPITPATPTPSVAPSDRRVALAAWLAVKTPLGRERRPSMGSVSVLNSGRRPSVVA